MKSLSSLLCAIAMLTGMVFASAPARADVVITPQRVVFEGDMRSATVAVVNSASERRTYDLTWSHTRMDADGRLVPVDSEAGSVTSFVTVSPRRISLEPGQSQTIRLALRRPPDLLAGEYRSHLGLQAIDVPDEAPQSESGEGMSAQLRIVLSFKIPVIVRHGPGASDVSLNAMQLDAEAQRLQVSMERNGPFSAYGDLHAFWRPDEAAELTAIGRISGVAIYPEVSQMVASVPLLPGVAPNLSTGEIFVYYVDPENDNAVMATTGARL